MTNEFLEHAKFCDQATKYIRKCLDNGANRKQILKSFKFMVDEELKK